MNMNSIFKYSIYIQNISINITFVSMPSSTLAYAERLSAECGCAPALEMVSKYICVTCEHFVAAVFIRGLSNAMGLAIHKVICNLLFNKKI